MPLLPRFAGDRDHAKIRPRSVWLIKSDFCADEEVHDRRSSLAISILCRQSANAGSWRMRVAFASLGRVNAVQNDVEMIFNRCRAATSLLTQRGFIFHDNYAAPHFHHAFFAKSAQGAVYESASHAQHFRQRYEQWDRLGGREQQSCGTARL